MKSGPKSLLKTKSLTAGPDGLVTCTWDVNPKTVLGTYPLEISGGGLVKQK